MRLSPLLCTRVRALFLCFACALTVNLAGQEAAVEGHVNDAEGTPLIGATVRVVGSVIGTTTDLDGRYDIEVPPGNIRLLYTYLGYQNLDTLVIVANGDRDIELNVIMRLSTANNLPELIVTSSRATGQLQALRNQQSALSVQTIIHSELFNQYPDITIAETVSRMPGVSIIRGVGEGQIVQVRGLPEQYTAVSLNGQRLPTIQPEADQEGTLDLIQSNLVEEVRVIKARTADMDGDAIGGTVDFRIRQPERKFEFLAQGGVGQNFGFDAGGNQGTGVTQLAGVLNSEIADEKLYALLAGSYLRQGRGTQQQIYDFVEGADGTRTISDARPNEVERLTERRGFVGGIELRPSIYNRLRIGFSSASTDEDITHRQLFARNLPDGASDLARRTSSWNKEKRLELLSLEVENNFPRTRLDYQLSFSQTSETLTDRLSSIAAARNGQTTFSEKALLDAQAASPFPGDALRLSETRQENIELREVVALFSVNVTRYLNKKKTSYLKSGVRYRSKDRNYGVFTANVPAPASPPVTLGSGEFPDLPEEPLVTELPDLREEGLRYSAQQRIWAGYAMFAANFTSRFSASAGVRYEGLEVDTYETDLDTFSFTEGSWLPNLNLTYRTNSTTKVRQVRQLRLSAYQAVARVNYSSFISGRRLPLIALDEFSRGNKGLRNTTSDNLDLTFERYGRRDGLVTVGLYYKRLKNPTLRVSTTDLTGVIPVYDTRLVNTASAELAGLEIGFYQNLGFLGLESGWRWFNLNGNYNFNALSAESRTFNFDSFTLPQAPRQTANLSVVYNNSAKGISVVVATNFRDRIFDRVLDNRTVYRNSVFSLDLAADYRFYGDFSVYLRANNISDHPFREYFGEPNDDDSNLRSDARYGAWGVIGIRYQPRGLPKRGLADGSR
ncbi:TonB-dependent receptor [Neolewinella antarctica]|uniref:TonB-dependent receptor n=1 Tax=Neolewinella antarctica TaxID=442734 RepID=A0ABX0X6P2_9BACT|nr:TonB-dependent receptor [Neolewinella antarctica]NJC24882.1 hypothetical protein [Neolewinella antarctica]